MGNGIVQPGSRKCWSQTKHTAGFHVIPRVLAVLSHPVASVVFTLTLI